MIRYPLNPAEAALEIAAAWMPTSQDHRSLALAALRTATEAAQQQDFAACRVFLDEARGHLEKMR